MPTARPYRAVLTVPAPNGSFDTEKIAQLEDLFGQEHERTYGHRAGPEEPVELVNAQLIGMGIPNQSRVPKKVTVERIGPQGKLPNRQAYFGRDTGWIETLVLHRSDLEKTMSGPLIIEEYDATCLVPPNAKASLDEFGNILIDL